MFLSLRTLLLLALSVIPPVVVEADASPFEWDTVLSMSYTFCFNATGPYNDEALKLLSRGKLFIHGMNERQEQPPQFLKSEEKTIAAANQLRQANPKQQQFYTIQNDFTRGIYDSGAWFNAHPECLLRDAHGDLVNNTQTKQKFPICTSGPNKDTCHVYGFQTQCGRDAWVKFAVETVVNGSLDGVFIDGFQGCSPYGGCKRAVASCTDEQASAWTTGLGQALWALHKQLKALGNKTIICNGTGEMYDCEGNVPCFCDAANKERFYPNESDLQQVVGAAEDRNGRNPYWGIIHVPHIDDGRTNFNKSLAGFLATAGAAGTAFGYGVGFGYDCAEGGWVRDFPELHKPLGPPAGPPQISHVTNKTAHSSAAALFTRSYVGGVKVWYNATVHPAASTSCIRWADGTVTDGNGGCQTMW